MSVMSCFLLASLLGTAAAQQMGCTASDICASGTYNGTNEVLGGYTCVDPSTFAVYGNTLDPTCAGGALSCVDGVSPIITASACTTPKMWIATTCDSFSAGTPTAQCAIAVTATVPVVPSCCVADDEPCFPGTAMVTLADGTSSRVDALKEGDKIVAATADGSLTTDTLSLLSIAHPEAIVDKFITLSTAGGASLTLTPNHHLPTGPACCSTLKMAKDVSIGEVVYTATEGKTTSTTVTGMHVTKATGLHSPVLANGNFPVVDGFVTSFDSIDKVTLAKHGLASLVSACKAGGFCETLRHLFLGEDRMLV